MLLKSSKTKKFSQKKDLILILDYIRLY